MELVTLAVLARRDQASLEEAETDYTLLALALVVIWPGAAVLDDRRVTASVYRARDDELGAMPTLSPVRVARWPRGRCLDPQ